MTVPLNSIYSHQTFLYPRFPASPPDHAMLADFLLKRKIAELVRRSRDVHRLDQYESIVVL